MRSWRRKAVLRSRREVQSHGLWKVPVHQVSVRIHPAWCWGGNGRLACLVAVPAENRRARVPVRLGPPDLAACPGCLCAAAARPPASSVTQAQRAAALWPTIRATPTSEGRRNASTQSAWDAASGGASPAPLRLLARTAACGAATARCRLTAGTPAPPPTRSCYLESEECVVGGPKQCCTPGYRCAHVAGSSKPMCTPPSE